MSGNGPNAPRAIGGPGDTPRALGIPGDAPRAIGIVVPSANVVVERTALRWAAGRNVDVNFTRVPVRGTVDPFPDGYDVEAFVAAAKLLADARPDVLIWAGSKGVLVGIEQDFVLKRAIENATGLPFTTSSLALADRAAADGLSNIGLVTPYTLPYQQRLIAGFARLGLTVTAEAHAGVADNLAYAAIVPAQIKRMALSLAWARPEAILAWCTNFDAPACAADIAAATGLPFLDATLLGLDHALALAAGARFDPRGLANGAPSFQGTQSTKWGGG